MKKLLATLAAGAAVLAFTAPTFAKPETPPEKVAICHYSEEDSKYILLNISVNAAMNGHFHHMKDGLPLGPVPGMEYATFSDTCTVVAKMPTVPTFTSPANNSELTSAELTEITWTTSVGTYGPMVYQYEAYGDSAYTSLIYSSGWLTENKIPTPGTPVGTYYIHVRAKDTMGNMSEWSNGSLTPYMIKIVEPTCEYSVEATGESYAGLYGSTVTPVEITNTDCSTVNALKLEATMYYGSGGWGGWSCVEAGYPNAIGGGYLPDTSTPLAYGVAEPTTTVGGYTYPNWPHYSFPSGEEGFVVQGAGAGNPANIYALCAPATP